MKVFCKVTLVAFVSFLCLGNWAWATEADGPKLVLQETEFDFGEVKEGTKVQHAFPVSNQGNQPLEIQKVNPG